VNKNLIPIVAVAAIFGLAIAGYFYWQSASKTPADQATDALDQASAPIVTVPESSIEGKIPELNPVKGANPFGETYKNPFAE